MNSSLYVSYVSLVVLAAVVILVSRRLFLSKSGTGRQIRAVSDDREAAQHCGTNYRHIFGIAAAIAFETVALAGISYGITTEFAPTSGGVNLHVALETVVIGDIGSLGDTARGRRARDRPRRSARTSTRPTRCWPATSCSSWSSRFDPRDSLARSRISRESPSLP